MCHHLGFSSFAQLALGCAAKVEKDISQFSSHLEPPTVVNFAAESQVHKVGTMAALIECLIECSAVGTLAYTLLSVDSAWGL